MADQDTVNMVMRDVLGHQVPGMAPKKELVSEAEMVEVNDDKLVSLIEGKAQLGVSSQCVLNYLNMKAATETIVEAVQPEAELTTDSTTQMISDMLGKF